MQATMQAKANKQKDKPMRGKPFQSRDNMIDMRCLDGWLFLS